MKSSSLLVIFMILCCGAVWLLLTMFIFGGAFSVFKIIVDAYLVDVVAASILTLMWIWFSIQTVRQAIYNETGND